MWPGKLVQPHDGITYGHKIDKSEAAIDWTQPAHTIAQRVRAFNPFPGASTMLGAEVLKVWSAQAVEAPAQMAHSFGQIVALAHTGIDVCAMNSIVRVTTLQRPGGKRLDAAEFLRGSTLHVGQVLG